MVMELLDHLSFSADLVGIGIIVWGFLLSLLLFLKIQIHTRGGLAFLQQVRTLRVELGTYLLLGLEFMVASDVIETVVNPSLDELWHLAGIVVLRTTIGYFTGKEINEEESRKKA